MKLHRAIWLSALLAMGCQSSLVTRSAVGTHTFTGSKTTSVTVLGTPSPSNQPLRVIGSDVVSVDLIGKVKLISDKGLGVISNNGGGLITNNGGNLISDKGLGIIANNAGSLVSGMAHALRVLDTGTTDASMTATTTSTTASTATTTGTSTTSTSTTTGTTASNEALLANATIAVYDATGNQLVDANKRPITAVSDQTGSYQFKTSLPNENLILRVQLFNGGQLEAMLPKAATSSGALTLNIDTASTLGASYVLQQFVQGNQTIYQRLPATDAATLQSELEAAVAKLTTPPSYKPADSVALTSTLEQSSTQVSATLNKIKAELLLGQQNLGSGLPATSVPLADPRAVVRDAAGDTFVAEGIGRIRKIDAQGNISLYAGLGPSGPVVGLLSIISDMVGSSDGTLYLAESATADIKKLTPSGQLTVVAGGGSAVATDGAVATSCKLGSVNQMALGADGTLYVTERPGTQPTTTGNVYKINADGTFHMLPAYDDPSAGTVPAGIAAGPDGTVYLAVGATPAHQPEVLSLSPGATKWTPIYQASLVYEATHLEFGADGNLYLADPTTGSLRKIDPHPAAGSLPTQAPMLAGGGQAAFQDGQSASAGSFETPGGFYQGADGTLLVVDRSAATIVEVTPAGTAKTYAGAEGLTQIGNTLGLAINTPTGVVTDANGNIVFAEAGGNTIKRLVGQTLQLIAGSTQGFADGVGKAAAFNRPGGLVYKGSDLYIADANNHVIRKITSDGTVSTVAGNGQAAPLGAGKVPAMQASIDKPSVIAVDPQGRLVVSDTTNSQIYRLNNDNTMELIAGSPTGQAGDSGDGGPATQALLKSPSGIACDTQGNVYVADSGNLRVRKIATDGTISTFAGLPMSQGLTRLFGGQIDNGPVPAAQALIVGPSGLYFDAKGNLYVCELGTNALSMGEAVTGAGATSSFAAKLPTMPARIRKITPDGTCSIVAGPGGSVLSDTGGDDALLSPVALTIDGQGRLVIVDLGADQIKVIPAGQF